MNFSDNYDVQKIGRDIIDIAIEIIKDPKLREVTEIGGTKDIVVLADTTIEDAVAKYITDNQFPVNLDGEERRRRELCDDPLGLITFDPMDGTDNYANNTLHYCTIASIFDNPNPNTLGEAVWAGIYDHVSRKGIYYHDKNVFHEEVDKRAVQKSKSPRIKSISDLKEEEYLKIFLDLGPRGTSEKFKPFDEILAKSWAKSVSCAGYHFMEIACGGRDAAIHPVQKPEELVAGIPLIEAVGGAVLTFDGKRAGDLPYDFDKRYPVVAATSPELAKDLVEMIKLPL